LWNEINPAEKAGFCTLTTREQTLRCESLWRGAIVSKFNKISFGWEYGGYEDFIYRI